MKLSIIEAGLSRRGFLKKSLAGAVVENKRIQFASFNSYGDITVYIDGKKYMYNTDALYHKKWKKKARYKPFSVLHDIKDQVKRGYASQIYP